MSQTVTKASNVSLLIALPLHPTSGPRVNWERGLEILPGAHLAVNDVNNDSTILPGHTLKLIVADSGRDQFEFVATTVGQPNVSPASEHCRSRWNFGPKSCINTFATSCK